MFHTKTWSYQIPLWSRQEASAVHVLFCSSIMYIEKVETYTFISLIFVKNVFNSLVPAVRISRGDVNQWLDESNHVTGRFVAELTANDVISVIRPSTLTNQLSNFKLSQSAGTNRLINCFSGQIRANIDLSLLKIALAALVQILQTSVNISPNWPEKQ